MLVTASSKVTVATAPDMAFASVTRTSRTPGTRAGVLDTAEALGEAWLVFQGFEVALGERVVVGGVRTVLRAGDAQIGQQVACVLAPATIGVHDELEFRDRR